MQTLDVGFGGRPLLDLRSFAHQGPGRKDRLSPAEIEYVALTVRRAPEVMIKVLPRGTQDLKSIQQHLAYIDRGGKVDLESDDGTQLSGKGVETELLESWDLDVEACRRRSELAATNKRQSPKLVHKLMFSMPAGTPPDKLLAAVRNFAREEFGLKHRYAMALHTDEPHPHVHMVVKAVSEQGARLNIKKATLRHWRSEFARNLRLLGVTANATERVIRGQREKARKDGIYRASLRGESFYLQAQAEAVAADLRKGTSRVEPGKRKLVETRREVLHGWHAVANKLAGQGDTDLASDVRRFATGMSPPHSERELVAVKLVRRARVSRKRPASTV